MTHHEFQVYKDVELILDDNAYVNCIMENVRLVYRGGSFLLKECSINDIQFILDGSAAGVVQTFRALYGSGGDGSAQRYIERVFEYIRGNVDATGC